MDNINQNLKADFPEAKLAMTRFPQMRPMERLAKAADASAKTVERIEKLRDAIVGPGKSRPATPRPLPDGVLPRIVEYADRLCRDADEVERLLKEIAEAF